MDADVNFIAAKLKEQVLTADEERSIVDLVRKWADSDTDAIIRGERPAGDLDRFIFKLRVRVVTRSTARSAFFFDTSVKRVRHAVLRARGRPALGVPRAARALARLRRRGS